MTAFLRQFPTPKRPNSQFSLGVLKVVFASLALAVTLAPALTVRAQDQPDRSKPPALGPTPQLKLPAIQKRALSNGVPIWLVEAHEVPLVQVSLLVKAGAGDDPAGKFGLASMTAAMMPVANVWVLFMARPSWVYGRRAHRVPRRAILK